MPPSIAPPPTDVLAALMSEHAHRFPQKAKLRVPDGGNEITLPILVGIPSGAVRLADGDETLPNGQKPSQAWARVMASSLGFRAEGPDDGRDLVADCMIYPSPVVWREWLERWPALDGPALRLVKQALGRDADHFYAPDVGEPTPADVKPSTRGVWRRLQPAPGVRVNVAVEPPPADNWRMYLNACREDVGSTATHTRAIVDLCTGGAAPDTLDRFPGMVLSLSKTVAYLAGAGAEGELGNW
jgi:hypothetical protein